jgi:hypothetical protein
VFVFGNSDGDKEMLEWTAAGSGARFMGLVHHTDAVREWAYDRNSPVGRLDKAWDEAVRRGRTRRHEARLEKSVSVRPLNGRGSIRPTPTATTAPRWGRNRSARKDGTPQQAALQEPECHGCIDVFGAARIGIIWND